MTDFDSALIDILGKDAYFSTDCKVTDNVRVLTQAVTYMFTQLAQCKNFMPEEDKDYVEGVKKNVIEILKGR